MGMHRWLFTEAELSAPETCRADDVFEAEVRFDPKREPLKSDPNVAETASRGILIRRDGSPTYLFADGKHVSSLDQETQNFSYKECMNAVTKIKPMYGKRAKLHWRMVVSEKGQFKEFGDQGKLFDLPPRSEDAAYILFDRDGKIASFPQFRHSTVEVFVKAWYEDPNKNGTLLLVRYKTGVGMTDIDRYIFSIPKG